jgi:hypothetical protein
MPLEGLLQWLGEYLESYGEKRERAESV